MHSKIKIRKVKKDYIKSIKDMDDFYLEAEHSTDYFLKNMNNILVASDGEEIIGYIMYKIDEVFNLVVHPDYRRKGVGKELMKEVMKNSKKLLCRTREKNQEAFFFLEKLGFKKKRRIEKYYKNGDNAIEMEWIK